MSNPTSTSKWKHFKKRCRVWYRWIRMMSYIDRKKRHEEWINRGCEYCGDKNICQECGRCYNRNCNSGCIFCNPIKEIEICKYCGQEIK